MPGADLAGFIVLGAVGLFVWVIIGQFVIRVIIYRWRIFFLASGIIFVIAAVIALVAGDKIRTALEIGGGFGLPLGWFAALVIDDYD